MLGKLRNWARNSTLTTAQQDNKRFYTAQVTSNKMTMTTQIVYPYGYYAVAPQGAQGITFQIMGQPENLVTIPYDAFTRFSGLQTYEVGLGNQFHRNWITFLNDGSINLITPTGNVTVSAPQGKLEVTVKGDVDITATTGNISVKSDAGTVTIDAQNAIMISSTSAPVTLQSGAATLELSASGLVSSVPISAPGMTMTGGGNVTMAGGAITGASDVTTSGGVSLASHTHSAGGYDAPSGGGPVTGDSGAPT